MGSEGVPCLAPCPYLSWFFYQSVSRLIDCELRARQPTRVPLKLAGFHALE